MTPSTRPSRLITISLGEGQFTFSCRVYLHTKFAASSIEPDPVNVGTFG